MKKLITMFGISALTLGALSGCGNEPEEQHMNWAKQDTSWTEVDPNSVARMIKNFSDKDTTDSLKVNRQEMKMIVSK